MPCCGQPPNGYTTVWQLRVIGEEVREFASQHEALIEQTKLGGRGVILKATKRQPGR